MRSMKRNMLEQSLQDAIEVYLKPKYVEVVENECELWERKNPGRTKLNVALPQDVSTLCLCDHDSKPKCEFINDDEYVGLRKSVDHVLLTPNADGRWTVHLIEMKTSVGRSEWQKISKKARATILGIKALAAILDIQIDSYKVYTTYGRLSYHVADPTNLAGRKAMLGGGWKELEWDRNQLPIYIPKGKKAYLWHKGIKMEKQTIEGEETLCGTLTLA